MSHFGIIDRNVLDFFYILFILDLYDFDGSFMAGILFFKYIRLFEYL